MTQCPKCHYIRQASDGGPKESCPRCGIIYAKFDAKVEQRREELKKVSEARLRSAALRESARINAEEASIRKMGGAGAGERHRNRTSSDRFWTSVAIAAVFVMFFVWFGPMLKDLKSATSRSGSSDWQYIEVGRKAVLASLKDPGSAQFRNEKRGRMAVCGEVNARNSFGGYIGFRRYIATSGIAFFEEQMSAGEFEKTWAEAC